MAEVLISNLGYGALQSDTKRQKLLECKLYLGKVYTEEQLAKVNEDKVEKILKSLGCSIINMYSMGACSVLGIT